MEAKIRSQGQVARAQTQAPKQGQVQRHSPTQAPERVQARAQTRVQAPSQVDTFHVPMYGLKHWYKDAIRGVGTLATMQDDDTNRSACERSLDQSLHQLVEAMRQRKKLLPDMPNDQLFDLNIMISQVLQLKICLTRLGPGR